MKGNIIIFITCTIILFNFNFLEKTEPDCKSGRSINKIEYESKKNSRMRKYGSDTKAACQNYGGKNIKLPVVKKNKTPPRPIIPKKVKKHFFFDHQSTKSSQDFFRNDLDPTRLQVNKLENLNSKGEHADKINKCKNINNPLTNFQTEEMGDSEGEAQGEEGLLSPTGEINDELLDEPDHEMVETDDGTTQSAKRRCAPTEGGPDPVIQELVEGVENSSISKVGDTVQDGGEGAMVVTEPEPEKKVPSKPAWVTRLLGTKTKRVTPVEDSLSVTPHSENNGFDPYFEFDPKFFKKNEKKPNPANNMARQTPYKLGLVGNPNLVEGVTNTLVDRRTLVHRMVRGTVDADKKGKFPFEQVDYESTFDGDMCLSCGPDVDGKFHQTGSENRVVVLGDAHFPPTFGAMQACIGVIRVNSATPEQLADALTKVLKSRTQNTVSKKRSSDRSVINPKIHVLWAVNSHIERVGVNRALFDINKAQTKVTSMSPQYEFSSAILVVPCGHEPDAVDEGVHDPFFDKTQIAKQNHALLHLSQALEAHGMTKGTHNPVMVKSFNVIKDQWPSGETRDHDGLEIYVEASHSVIGNREDLFLPSNIKLKAVATGALSAHGLHLALDPRVEFMFLSTVVEELKTNPKFRSIFVLPDDNHILAGVSQGVPIGKTNNEHTGGKIALENLIKYAGQHHADLVRKGLATTIFNPPGSGSTRFFATGELCIIGNSEAKSFAAKFEAAKKKTLAENNYAAEKKFLTGGTQMTCQAYLEKSFTSVSKPDRGVTVIWILSNMMLVDRSGRYQILTETHGSLISKKQEYPRKNTGNSNVWSNGKVWGKKYIPPSKFQIKSPIHTLNSRVRTDKEVDDLLTDVLSRVSKLLEQGGYVILVGPMPRHPEACCSNSTHMMHGFSAADYTRRCYLVSTFLVMALQQKNISVLHPGEIFGWGESPDIIHSLRDDGVHLNGEAADRARNIIERRVAAFTRDRAEAARVESVEDRASKEAKDGEGDLQAGEYCEPFLATMQALGQNSAFVKPGPKVAGDL